MESPCPIHQAGILVSVHCLTLLDKQALYLLVAQGKLPFTLCYPVKYFLTTTLQAAESLLIPTALELVNNSSITQQLQTLAVKGAPLRSCPTGSQSKGHPARVGGLSPTSVNPAGITSFHNAKFSDVPIKQSEFDWNATNLSQEFSAFKRICKSLLEDGPHSDLSEKQKVATVLNWLGWAAYKLHEEFDYTGAYKNKVTDVLKSSTITLNHSII